MGCLPSSVSMEYADHQSFFDSYFGGCADLCSLRKCVACGWSSAVLSAHQSATADLLARRQSMTFVDAKSGVLALCCRSDVWSRDGCGEESWARVCSACEEACWASCDVGLVLHSRCRMSRESAADLVPCLFRPSLCSLFPYAAHIRCSIQCRYSICFSVVSLVQAARLDSPFSTFNVLVRAAHLVSQLFHSQMSHLNRYSERRPQRQVVSKSECIQRMSECHTTSLKQSACVSDDLVAGC